MQGPWHLPILGALPLQLYHQADRLDWYTSMTARYGVVWRAFVPGAPFLLVANAACVEHVLKTNFANYPKVCGVFVYRLCLAVCLVCVCVCVCVFV